MWGIWCIKDAVGRLVYTGPVYCQCHGYATYKALDEYIGDYWWKSVRAVSWVGAGAE